MISSESEKCFPAVLEQLYNMLQIVKIACSKANVKPERISKLELACEEFIVNIISYAYTHEKNPGSIFLSCHQTPSYFEVIIKDTGVPFNPLDTSMDISDLPPEHRPLGGLGIFLARSSVDRILYERDKTYNIVHIQIDY